MSTDPEREALPPVPGLWGIRWRHRNGGTYRAIATGLIEATLTPCVVYVAEKDGRVWVRPYAEFTDGRFTCIDEDADHDC